jgi:hypothetical protein
LASIRLPKRRSGPNGDRSGSGTSPFRSARYAALREAYTHLAGSDIEILRATNHINQRSFYFANPDGNTLKIYYDLPHALKLFRGDRDEALQVSGPGEPLPGWLLEDWPGPEMMAQNRGSKLAQRNATPLHPLKSDGARTRSLLINAPHPAAGYEQIKKDEAEEDRQLSHIDQRKKVSRRVPHEIGYSHIAGEDEGHRPSE